MRILVPLAILLLALTLAPPVGGALGDEPGPCAVPPFLPGWTLVPAPPGSWLRVSFHIASPVTDILWSSTALHAATTAITPPAYYGYSAERAMATGFLSTGGGAPVSTGGFLMYPYGVQLDTPDGTLRVAAADDATCGAAAGGSTISFPAGDHTFLVLPASELANGAAAFLPSAATITGIETGPVSVLQESSFNCAVKLHAQAAGFSSAALASCSTPYSAGAHAARALFVGRFPDAAHTVQWVDPAGHAGAPVAFYDGAIGAPGVWTLSIPRYATALGQPFGLPVPTPAALGSDSGVFGAFADVP